MKIKANNYFINLDFNNISKQDVLTHQEISENEFGFKSICFATMMTIFIFMIFFISFNLYNNFPKLHTTTITLLLILIGGIILFSMLWIFLNKSNQYLMKVNRHNLALNQMIFAQYIYNKFNALNLNSDNKTLIDDMSNYIIKYEGINKSTKDLSLNDLELYLSNINNNHKQDISSNKKISFNDLENNLSNLYDILTKVEEEIKYKVSLN